MDKLSKLTGVAAGVLLAVGAAAQAQAQPAKGNGVAASPSAAEARLAAEIEALKAQVKALSERLAAQERAQQQIQAQAAQARAEAGRDIERIPNAASTEVATAAPKPKASWADSTQVSGRMYYNITSIENESDGADVAPSGTSFEIKRFYVGIDHKFNETFSGSITTDFQYQTAENVTQIYIKNAYLQAKLSDAAVLRLGSTSLPWVPFVEDLYGYRFVETVLVDRTRNGTSADWGVHASGKLADGHVNYAVSVINGAGFRRPIRTKAVDVEGRVNLNLDKVVLGIGGYSGKLGNKVEGGPPTPHTAQRFNAVAAWVNPKYRVGVEYFWTKNWRNVTSVAEDKSDGYSLFGSINLTPEISTFARWDRVKPSKDRNAALTDNYFNIGLNWEPVKTVDLALVYKRDKVENGLFSTTNGTIGGTRQGTYDELGLFGQFRW